MKRRAGFTLIEVMAAVLISVASLLLAAQLGWQWWQYNQEEQFFTAFEAHWHALMQEAQEAQGAFKSVTMIYWDNTRTLEFRRGNLVTAGKREIQLPKGMIFNINDVESSSERSLNQTSVTWDFVNDKHFTQMRTMTFTRNNGDQVHFTTQLGWGVLIRQND